MSAGDAQAWFIAGTIVVMVAGGGHALSALVDTVRPRSFAPIESSVKQAMEGTSMLLVRRWRFGGSSARPSIWRVWLGINIGIGLGGFACAGTAWLGTL